jgi:MFS family permease
MWYWLGVTYIAALSIVDFMMFNYIGFRTNVSDVDYGIIGAAWSAVFIATSELLGRLADRGDYRRLSAVSLTFIAAASVLFALARGVWLMALAYIFHAVATSTANLGFSASLFELSPDVEWESRTSGQRLGLYGIRGLGLLALALAVPFVRLLGLVVGVGVAAVAIGLLFLTALPSQWITFERKLHGVINRLSLTGAYTAALGSFVSYRYGILYSISRGVARGSGSSMGVALSATLTTFVGDYYLTALPLILRQMTVGLRDYMIAFAAAGLATALTLAMVQGTSSRSLAAAGIALRGAWAIAAVSFIRSMAGLAAYIVILVALFGVLDLSLYQIYIGLTGGYRVHGYMVLRELGSLAGSLAGGVALYAGPMAFMVTPAVVTGAAVAALLA